METKGARDTGNRSIPAFSLGTVYQVNITVGSLLSVVLGEGITMIRVWGSVDYHLVTGATPVAAETDSPFTAKVTEFFKIKGGQDRVAVIRAAGAGDGTLWITELN